MAQEWTGLVEPQVVCVKGAVGFEDFWDLERPQKRPGFVVAFVCTRA